MAEFDFPTPPILAVGKQGSMSGFGCAMQAVSWITGDLSLSDFPECADRYLARMVQGLNDGICWRLGCSGESWYGSGASAVRTATLCVKHSQEMVGLALETVGTAIEGDFYKPRLAATDSVIGLYIGHVEDNLAYPLLQYPKTAIANAHKAIAAFKEAAGITGEQTSREEVAAGLDAMREHAVACGVPVA